MTTLHALPEPGRGTILALNTWNILLVLAVLGRNCENKTTSWFAKLVSFAPGYAVSTQ